MNLETALMVLALIAVGILAVPLLYAVHLGLEYCCLRYVERFCRRHGYEINRWRCGPDFDSSGIKTEFMLVELDCVDGQKQRRLVCLLVWLFGIHKVVYDGEYRESDGGQSTETNR